MAKKKNYYNDYIIFILNYGTRKIQHFKLKEMMTKDCREETTIILIFEWRNDFTARYAACYTRWANHEKMDSHSKLSELKQKCGINLGEERREALDALANRLFWKIRSELLIRHKHPIVPYWIKYCLTTIQFNEAMHIQYKRPISSTQFAPGLELGLVAWYWYGFTILQVCQQTIYLIFV